MADTPSRNEEQYVARRDALLLRQSREALRTTAIVSERRSDHRQCPTCGYTLIRDERHGGQIDQGTHSSGIWFAAEEARSLLAHAEPTIITRAFRAVMQGGSGVPGGESGA